MKNIMKQLVQESYTNDELDGKKVAMIGSKLRRSELKLYLKALRLEEQKKHVIIATASKLSAQDEDKLRKHFPQKKVIFQVDSTLISGIRVLDNDVTYERNISQVFDDMALYLGNL